jgi:hypothetical protein
MSPVKWKAPVVEGPEDLRSANRFDEFRLAAGLTHGELWLRYFELGGMSTAIELEAIVYGALVPSAHDYEVIALALNERFVEINSDQVVPYLDEPGDAEDLGPKSP